MPTTSWSQQSPPEGSSSPTTRNPAQWTAAPLVADDAEEGTGLDDIVSSTASLSSSVTQYRTVQGRTYHSSRGNAEYWGSNNDRQGESMDLAQAPCVCPLRAFEADSLSHHVHTLILGGKLFLAPLKDDIQSPKFIDVATHHSGIDFADAYPNCEVVGTEIDDRTQPWTFEPDSIDFAHIRYLTGSIQDWPALFKEAYRCVKPEGYIQSFEAEPIYMSDDGTVSVYVATLQRWSKEDVTVYAARFRREARNPAIHGYYRMKLIWAKEPEG